MDLDGIGALVAGGASGLGEATARALVERGARVAIADLNEDRTNALADELGDAAVGFRCDVTNEADVEGAVAGAVEALGELRLAHLADRLPGEVSLGEQQRTALARALVVRPAFLVADEPTGQLDEELTGHVLTRLRVACAAGTGVLVASHDPAVAAADRVVRLEDGRLVD